MIGDTSSKGPVSIAMLDYRSVTPPEIRPQRLAFLFLVTSSLRFHGLDLMANQIRAPVGKAKTHCNYVTLQGSYPLQRLLGR